MKRRIQRNETTVQPLTQDVTDWIERSYRRDRLGDLHPHTASNMLHQLRLYGYALISHHDSVSGMMEVAKMPEFGDSGTLADRAWRYGCRSRGLDPDDIEATL